MLKYKNSKEKLKDKTQANVPKLKAKKKNKYEDNQNERSITQPTVVSKEVTEKNKKITKTRKKNPLKRRHESLKFKGPTKQQKGLNIRIRMEDPSTSL